MSAPAASRRDPLREMPADLRLPGALEAVDGAPADVDSGVATAGEAIERLLGAQTALRNDRRSETAMRASRPPAVKTPAQFDFAFQPDVKRERIESLHELGFLGRRGNVVLLGPPGVGKTHLAVSPATAAAESGRRVHYGTPAGLIESPSRAHPSSAAGGRRDRLSAGQPGRRRALPPVDQRPPRTGVHGAHLEQGVRGVGRRARRRGDGRGAHRPPSAPLPHRQHPRQQLPHEAPSGTAPVHAAIRGRRRPRNNRVLTVPTMAGDPAWGTTGEPAPCDLARNVRSFQLSKVCNFRLPLT